MMDKRNVLKMFPSTPVASMRLGFRMWPPVRNTLSSGNLHSQSPTHWMEMCPVAAGPPLAHSRCCNCLTARDTLLGFFPPRRLLPKKREAAIGRPDRKTISRRGRLLKPAGRNSGVLLAEMSPVDYSDTLSERGRCTEGKTQQEIEQTTKQAKPASFFYLSVCFLYWERMDSVQK